MKFRKVIQILSIPAVIACFQIAIANFTDGHDLKAAGFTIAFIYLCFYETYPLLRDLATNIAEIKFKVDDKVALKSVKYSKGLTLFVSLLEVIGFTLCLTPLFMENNLVYTGLFIYISTNIVHFLYSLNHPALKTLQLRFIYLFKR